jgi:hypothetical protein
VCFRGSIFLILRKQKPDKPARRKGRRTKANEPAIQLTTEENPVSVIESKIPPLATQNPQSDIPNSKSAPSLFHQSNRGLLLDLFIFVANLFLMRYLTGLFIDLFTEADAREPLAQLGLGLTAVAMWSLPLLGAVSKRWHFHQRLKAEGKAAASSETALGGCLFNPLFYFCMNLVLTSVVVAGLGQQLFGKLFMNSPFLFVSMTIIGLCLTIVQTYLIYQYFSPPKRPPRTLFLRQPQSETFGDICFFVNMMLFQVVWNLLTFAELGRVSGVGEFAVRLFFLCFIALLIYFPPRMLYLAEDINRPRTWLTMLLANSPVIVKVLLGSE